jgi:hypothetical protein
VKLEVRGSAFVQHTTPHNSFENSNFFHLVPFIRLIFWNVRVICRPNVVLTFLQASNTVSWDNW